MLDTFVTWLAGTPGSIALHESLYAYSVIETLHVMTLALFVGTIALVDLRVLGVALRQVPLSKMLSKILPWTVAGFLILVVTGLALFYAIPERTFHSIWFRSKVLLLILAGVNVLMFHNQVMREPELWDSGPTPSKARRSAIFSLCLWAGVIIFGRFIAYNWFDCDKPQPPFVQFVAACPVRP